MIRANFSDLAFNSNISYFSHLTAEEMQAYSHVFIPHGYIYSVFGGIVHGIPNVEEYKTLVMVRDPRDVLTSTYFSVALSHKPPGGEGKRRVFSEQRARARRMNLDEFVISESDRVRGTYEDYMNFVTAFRNTHVATYEAMITDFPAWLEDVLDFCGLEIDAKLRQDLIEEESGSEPGSEDIYSHLRQRASGDHRRKLRAETIARLDEELGPVLTFFGYR